MSYKPFGRLAGKTNATDALHSTAPASAITPFSPPSPASKMLAYGENAQSTSFNRALGALSANTDYLHAVLSSPALRADMLAPERTEGGKQSGFSALTGLEPSDTEISLGVGTRRPIAWVYLGLHKDQMHKYVRAYRRLTGVTADVYLQATEANAVSPSDAKINSDAGTPSFFPTQTYVGSEEHALVDKIPAISRISSDLPPYAGAPPAAYAAAIQSWDSDGFYVTAVSSEDLYLRPGCFVEVYNETSPTTNNGLWRVEAIRRADKSDPAGDKVLLSTGGLHLVTVDDSTNFNAGERVTWRSRPNDTLVSTPELREHYAYIAYKIGNDLYLADFAGGEDLKVQGGNIAYKANMDSAAYRGFKNINHVGRTDQESDADQNWSMTVGTQLYNLSGAVVTEVSSVQNAGRPVAFSVSSQTGNFYACAPLGWALNPTLIFDAGTIVGGDYYVDCFTLTTVAEQLVSQGAGAARASSEAPFAALGMSRNAMFYLNNALKFMKMGKQTESLSGPALNGPFAASKMILGEQLWKIAVVHSAGPVVTVDAVLTAGDYLNGATAISMTGPNTVTSTATEASVVSVGSNNEIVLSDVSRVSWSLEEDFSLPPIEVGSTFTVGGTTFQVGSILMSPKLADSAATEYYPSYGLQAAYNSDFSASPAERNRGLGNTISLVSGKPLTILQLAGLAGGGLDAVEIRDNRTDAGIISLKQRDGTIRARIKEASNALTLRDTNTGSDIPFSGAAPFNALPGTAASVLEALHGGVMGATGITGPWSTAILGGGTVTTTGLDVNITSGLYVKEGKSFTCPAASAFGTLPAAGTRYVACAPATGTYSLETTLDPSDIDLVYLTKYVTVGSAITETVDIRMPIRRVDAKMELTVGVPRVVSYASEVADFLTLSDAFAAISVWENDSSGSYKIPWSIRVIGGVDESVADLPLTIPANGMVIHGAPHADHEIVWANGGADANVSLFDMNGKSGLVFRDLNIRYVGDTATAATDPANLNRVVWNGRGSSASDWLFDNVTVRATTARRLHGYLDTTGGTASTRIRVKNCSWIGASEFGIKLADPGSVYITDSELTGVSVTPQSTDGGQGAVVLSGVVGQAGPVWVMHNKIVGWQLYGVGLINVSDASVAYNYIDDIDADVVNNEAAYGIYSDDDCNRLDISNNRIVDIGQNATGLTDIAVGIMLRAPKSSLSHNNAALHASAVAGASTSLAGIMLDTTALNCIAIGNQTNGMTLVDAGTGNTIANNRDDV